MLLICNQSWDFSLFFDIMTSMNKYASQGERIRFLRSLTGLSAKDFCARFDISISSFGKWEAGINPLSLSKANRLIAIATENKINCPISWLLHGKGEEARVMNEKDETIILSSPTPASPSTYEEKINVISKEIDSLKKIHQLIEVLIIADDSMLPQFNVHDYVGGTPINIDNLKKYLDFPCIVETTDGRKKLRRIGYNQGKFFLFGTNTNFKGAPLFELAPDFAKVSPVFWHRILWDKRS